jgi:hypothetical protein
MLHFKIMTNKNKNNLNRVTSSKGLHTLPESGVVPVAVYSDADLQRKQILDENRGKSGVYR